MDDRWTIYERHIKEISKKDVSEIVIQFSRITQQLLKRYSRNSQKPHLFLMNETISLTGFNTNRSDNGSVSVSAADQLLIERSHDEIVRSTALSWLHRIVAWMCTTFFLSILMVLALFHYYYGKISGAGVHSHQSPRTPAYPNAEGKKLARIPDLGYYLNMLNLELLEYRIKTKDGFIITLQRITDPSDRDQLNRRPPVLLVHGLLQSSGSFVTSGEKSLAVFLFRNGFDVWLGNNRCGFVPRNETLSPQDPRMWDWDVKDLAMFDLPAMVDEILKVSAFDKVSLCCHSQGTSQTFLALSEQHGSAINHKITTFIALSPAVFRGALIHQKLFIKFIQGISDSTYKWFFGVHSFMPIMLSVRGLIYKYSIFGLLSYSMFNFLFDWTDTLWDPSLRSQHFLFSPVYVSTKLMAWWLCSQTGGFGSEECILDETQSWFDPARTPPIMLVIPLEDRLVDGEKLKTHMRLNEPRISTTILEIEKYAHLDVLWADDVIEKVGYPILEHLNMCVRNSL
ncbi:unnamed protein product [Kuraishia capsulata CBS 1993]|uniref:Partial AB-hydrolase lipase domain-containing protein n=1 Tax=Kuraishia capsulata CBS 1993 TaxID=1382522 RepID=W6MQK9_9ASCO|nr:uncharacterized protein KUCA_T00005005001 [Kuraishia capsulata CBS 1993]CDK29019.1 unnamed protein product [Kuraishia capsulata CBS 1993]